MYTSSELTDSIKNSKNKDREQTKSGRIQIKHRSRTTYKIIEFVVNISRISYLAWGKMS